MQARVPDEELTHPSAGKKDIPMETLRQVGMEVGAVEAMTASERWVWLRIRKGLRQRGYPTRRAEHLADAWVGASRRLKHWTMTSGAMQVRYAHYIHRDHNLVEMIYETSGCVRRMALGNPACGPSHPTVFGNGRLSRKKPEPGRVRNAKPPKPPAAPSEEALDRDLVRLPGEYVTPHLADPDATPDAPSPKPYDDDPTGSISS